MPKIVFGDETHDAAQTRQRGSGGSPTAWPILAALGVGVVMIGLADLLSVWWPLDFGAAHWELDTVSLHFNRMLVPTVGLGLTAVGLLGLAWHKALRGLAALFYALAAIHFGLLALYSKSIPFALSDAVPDARTSVMAAIARTLIVALVYGVLYAWLGWRLWKERPRPH